MSRELGIGGTERQLVQTALTLDRSRFAPHVACFNAGGFRAAALRAAGIPIVELPVRSFMRWSAVAGAWRLARYLRAHHIQVVHAFDVPMDVFGVPVARFARTPVVISSQRAHRDLTPGIVHAAAAGHRSHGGCAGRQLARGGARIDSPAQRSSRAHSLLAE